MKKIRMIEDASRKARMVDPADVLDTSKLRMADRQEMQRQGLAGWHTSVEGQESHFVRLPASRRPS